MRGSGARPWVGETGLSFHAYNRGKRGVTLDLKSAEDVAQLQALARDADILIQNLRPGVVEALGIGPDAMLAANPRLVYCSIWAFGYTGPLRLAPGFDPLLQAYGAMLTSPAGRRIRRPSRGRRSTTRRRRCGASSARWRRCGSATRPAGLRRRHLAVRERGGLGGGAAEWLSRLGQDAGAARHRQRQPRALPDLRHRRPADLRRRRQPAALGEVRRGHGASGMGRGCALPTGRDARRQPRCAGRRHPARAAGAAARTGWRPSARRACPARR